MKVLRTICGSCGKELPCGCAIAPRGGVGRIEVATGDQKSRSSVDRKNGWRVDAKIRLTGLWAEYTSRRQLVTKELAESLARYLKRQGSPGRLVEVIDGVDHEKEAW